MVTAETEISRNALADQMAPGGTRSLNLATAVAIVLYEAVRQQAPEW